MAHDHSGFPDLDDLAIRHARRLSEQEGVDAVYLRGSLARGAADQWSDIDLLAVCAGTTTPAEVGVAIKEGWTGGPDGPWLANSFGGERMYLLNFVFPPWLRVDVSVTTEPTPDAVRLDPASDRLSPADAALPAVDFDVAAATRTLAEMVRVFGLAPTVLGRNDLITARAGCHLLWDHFMTLALLSAPGAGRVGALSAARLLSPVPAGLLGSLPEGGESVGSVVRFHEAVWQSLLKLMATEPYATVPWPERQILVRLQQWLSATLGLTIELPAA